ncbi:MAG TPA: type II secretion system F family protein [Candidatus Hydrogenedentes bacterium]|nr:type II secretion system F family protein [Candidatus Hydrogenedentota bacterium]
MAEDNGDKKRKNRPAGKRLVIGGGAEQDASAPSSEPSPGGSGRSSFSVVSGVREGDIVTFLRQLILLLESGTSLLRALKTLSERGSRPALKAMIGRMAASVEEGNPLWMAFEQYPAHFDTVFVNLIRASEASGTLTTVLRRLTDYRESRQLLRKRVRSAMVYPVVLLLACFGAVVVLSAFVVPVFEDFFVRAGLPIPGGTRVMIAFAAIVRDWWWLPIVVVAGLAAFYRFWFIRSPERRLVADRIKLRIPLVGQIIHKNAIAELCRTLALLLRSGVSMMSTLELTRYAIHNRAVAETLTKMRDSVEKGGGLEEPMRSSGVIPDVVADMIATGEESGRVDAIAEQIADVYEEEVRIAVSGLGEALQPVFTVFMGAIVLLLFAGLFLPMIGMIDQLGKTGTL